MTSDPFRSNTRGRTKEDKERFQSTRGHVNLPCAGLAGGGLAWLEVILIHVGDGAGRQALTVTLWPGILEDATSFRGPAFFFKHLTHF